MRKFKFFSLFLTLLALVFSISAVKAQDEMPPPEDQRPPLKQTRPRDILRELNLSREQIQQIRRINQGRKPLMREAQRRFRQANRALDEAIYADAPDEMLVRERMKEVQMAHAEIIKLRTATEFLIRRVLTPEQVAKFRDLRQRFMPPQAENDLPPRPNQTFPPQARPVNNPNRPRPKRGF